MKYLTTYKVLSGCRYKYRYSANGNYLAVTRDQTKRAGAHLAGVGKVAKAPEGADWQTRINMRKNFWEFKGLEAKVMCLYDIEPYDTKALTDALLSLREGGTQLPFEEWSRIEQENNNNIQFTFF